MIWSLSDPATTSARGVSDMVVKYAARFADLAENFADTWSLHNAAMDEMRQINDAYKKRRDADAKEIEYQRNNLSYIMGSDDYPAADRAEAKHKLAQLEFHTCLPTPEERAAYRNARELAEKHAHALETYRDALSASRKALKDAIAAAEKATLQNEKAARAWINTQLDRLPEDL